MTGLLGPFLHPGGRALSERVLDLADVGPGEVLVDLGAGEGATLALAREREPAVRGIGIDSGFPARRDGAARIRGTGLRLPLRDRSASGAIAECSLCLMRPLDATLREVRRILRPGGRLVVSDFYAAGPLEWPPSLLALWSCVLDSRPAEDILRGMRSAGFESASVEDRSEGLWEIEERVQRKVDVRGLIAALAASQGGMWAEAARFLDDVIAARDRKALRYGVFVGSAPAR